MSVYFVCIWKKTGEETSSKTRSMVEIRKFFSCDDAWKFVEEEKIEHFVVFKAECIIDKS